jgi:iron complex outermembrane receptor protein
LEGIEAGSLDRIEVVRGAGSSLYGNAAGGVVNLRTAEFFPTTGAQFEATGGGFGYFHTKLSAGTGPGSLGEGGTVSLSHVKTDGWREHSAYEAQVFTGSWRVRATDRSRLRALFYLNNTSAQIPGPLTLAEFAADATQGQPRYIERNVRRYTRKGRLGLNYVRALSKQVDVTVTPFAAIKKLDRPRENNQYQLITRYILGTNAQAEWKTHAGSSEAELIGGFDQQFQDGPVTWYGMEDGNRTNELLSQEMERQWGQGYFVQWEMENARWGGLVGARYDRVYMLDAIYTDGTQLEYDKKALTPRVGFRYHVKKDWVAFASVYGGFETPALSETENPFNYFVEPQKTVTAEFGLRGDHEWSGSHLQCEATVYTMNVTDAIVPDSDVDPADSTGTVNFYTNAGAAVHRGLEMSAKWSKPRWGYVGLAASVGEFSFTDYVNRLGQDFTDNKVAGVSPDMLNAVLRWIPRDEFYVEFNVRNYGAAYANSANTAKADGLTVLGAGLGGRLPVKALSASWNLGAANLTDETYVSFIQVNDANGRYYEAGMPFTVFGGISLGTKGL